MDDGFADFGGSELGAFTCPFFILTTLLLVPSNRSWIGADPARVEKSDVGL